jgi:hypothetical protein
MITPSYGATATERVLPKLFLDFTTGTLDSRVTFSRALNTATRINSSGLMELVNANIARFDYDPVTLAPKGLLVEETRVNSVLQSGFAGAVAGTPGTFPTSWTSPLSGGSISAVTADSLGGNILTFSATAARQIMQQVVSVAANTSYCLSLYIHSNSGLPLDDILFAVSPPAGATTGYYVNDTAVLGSYVPTAGQRVHILAVIGATAGSITWRIAAGASRSVTGSVSFSKPQFEAGAFPTSYIPTTTGSVTRNSDVAYITGANLTSWFNATEGALAVTATTSEVPSTDASVRYAAALYDTLGFANALRLERLSGSYRAVKTVSGSSAVRTNTWTYNTRGSAVCAYKLNNSASSFNAASAAALSGGVPSGIAFLGIGGNSGGSNMWCGHIQNLRYWPQRLTDAEVQAFSK